MNVSHCFMQICWINNVCDILFKENICFVIFLKQSTTMKYIRKTKITICLFFKSGYISALCAQLLSHVQYFVAPWSLPGSSALGINLARILEWDAISYSRGSSQTRDQMCVPFVSCFGKWIFSPLMPTGKPIYLL